SFSAAASSAGCPEALSPPTSRRAARRRPHPRAPRPRADPPHRAARRCRSRPRRASPRARSTSRSSVSYRICSLRSSRSSTTRRAASRSRAAPASWSTLRGGTSWPTIPSSRTSATRTPETRDIFLEDLLQTDAAINEGNSGGPLIWAATRQVIGVNTLVASNATGLGFAISSNTVRQVADELIRNGKILRGFIGIQYTLLSPRQAAQLGLPAGTAGIIVSQVVPGSPAQQAGLRPNDIITKVN